VRFHKDSIRFRLTLGFIAVILVANAVLFLVTWLIARGILHDELITRVRLDLISARGVYDGKVAAIAAFLRAASTRRSVPRPLAQGVPGDLDRLMDSILAETGIDILSLLDREGRIVYRSHNPRVKGDLMTANPIVSLAIKRLSPVSGTVIVKEEALKREGRALFERACFEIRPTLDEPPSGQTLNKNGMAIGAAVPLVDLGRDGMVIGFLYGANLLNRNYQTIETIKNGVFQEKTPDGKDLGLVSIFQGDIRISTNVLDEKRNRIIGSHLDPAIRDSVLRNGQTWAGRAPVINDWYIAAYEPIRDPLNRVIGILAVGLLESPFSRPQTTIVEVFLGVMVMTTVVSLILLFFVTRTILQPVGRLLFMSQKVIAGDLSARVGIRPPGEMGQLCRAIDQMAGAVEQRERDLEQAARSQIDRSEKLASVGRLAAGIAHEVNNPLTGVLTFAHLMREKPDLGEKERERLDVIIRETTRVREIVRGLLDFAREAPSNQARLDVTEVLRQSIQLIRSQKALQHIRIEEHLAAPGTEIVGDRNRLLQVFLNLALNACEAMQKGGTLTVSTSAAEERLVVSFEDTGCGIPPEHLDHIFDPFFTTKSVGSGTGLGLSVSYGIVEQHGGRLEVHSLPGEGTRFDVFLPMALDL